MKVKSTYLLLAFFCQSVLATTALPPSSALTFVKKSEKLIQHKQADLNSDGLLDYVLILEHTSGLNEGERSLLIITGEKGNGFKLAKRSDKIVYCLSCGGVWGDPFESVEVGKNTFTVNHYGGSAWRWTVSYKFNYSKRDDSWQLVKVVQTSFHAAEPENVKKRVLVPPKDYGLIDIADFDPERFIGAGLK